MALSGIVAMRVWQRSCRVSDVVQNAKEYLRSRFLKDAIGYYRGPIALVVDNYEGRDRGLNRVTAEDRLSVPSAMR